MHNAAHETSRVNHAPQYEPFESQMHRDEYESVRRHLHRRRAVRLTLLTVGVAGLIVAAALAVGWVS